MTDPVKVARDISRISDGEAVLIGGVATYLHVQRRPRAGLPLEMTHDTDAAISVQAAGNLRDELQVTPNPRLHKEQVTVGNVEVDLYPQFVSRLRYSYDDLTPDAQRYRGFQIAAVPHLLLLKLDAFLDRRASQKGAKDRRDISKLLVLLDGSPQARALLKVLATHADLRELTTIVQSGAFGEIARGNAKRAAEFRRRAEVALDKVSS